MKNILLGFSLAMALLPTYGFAQKVMVRHNNIFYQIEETADNTTLVHQYRVDKAFKATLSDKTDYLQIAGDEEFIDKTTKLILNEYITEVSTFTTVKAPTSTRAELARGKGKYYFPEIEWIKDDSIAEAYAKRDYLSYRYGKLMLQTLAIPLKIRPKVEKAGETIYGQAEAAFNVGFALGWKFSFDRWSPTKNLLGSNSSKFSLTPGALVNFGSTTLDDKNTRPKLAIARRAFTISTGIVGLVGWNNVNFGVAYGWDFPTGRFKEDWFYANKRNWFGLIIALDLLK